MIPDFLFSQHVAPSNLAYASGIEIFFSENSCFKPTRHPWRHEHDQRTRRGLLSGTPSKRLSHIHTGIHGRSGPGRAGLLLLPGRQTPAGPTPEERRGAALRSLSTCHLGRCFAPRTSFPASAPPAPFGAGTWPQSASGLGPRTGRPHKEPSPITPPASVQRALSTALPSQETHLLPPAIYNHRSSV